MSRQTIRTAIADAIRPAVLAHDATTQLYAFKKGAPKSHDPIVCVYLNTGQVTNHPAYREDDAELTIDILLPDDDNVDDLLDQFSDAIEASISAATLGADVQNLLLTAWEYVRDELPGWTALRLTYSILY